MVLLNHTSWAGEMAQRVRALTSAFERMLHEHHGRYGADIMEMYSTESLCKNLRRYIELLVLRIFMERN